MSWFQKFLGRSKSGQSIAFANSIELRWDDFFWAGETILPAWAGFQKRLGAYCAISGTGSSNGEVRLSISSPTEKTITAPSKAQFNGYRYLLQHGESVRDKVLQAIFDAYPDWKAQLKDFLGDDLEHLMPTLTTPLELRALIGLSTVHILSEAKDEHAFVGFEFGCTWEEEHGLGVMSHRDQIVAVGAAEDSFSFPV